MKVICIAAGKGEWIRYDNHEIVDGPDFGEKCTVIGDKSELGYELEEYPSPDDIGWQKTMFIPIMPDKEDLVLVEEELQEDEVRN